MNITIENIITAAGEGDVQKIKYLLLMSKATYLNSVGAEGYTALTLGAAKGRTKILETLFEQGCAIDARDRHGLTALHHAIIKKKISAVVALLKHGASPNCRFDDDELPLVRAVQNGSKEVVDAFIESGADINAVGRNGYTTLMRAVSSSVDVLFVYALISRGADVTIQNDFGGTALHEAATSSNIGAVVALLNAGAAVNVADKHATTPLANAVMHRDVAVEVVELLLKHGANPNVIEKHGSSILDRAIARDNTAVIELLLEYGADPDARGWLNESLRSQMVRKNRPELLQLIAENEPNDGPKKINPVKAIQSQPSVKQRDTAQNWNLAEITNDINKLIGLKEVKLDIERLTNFLRVQQLRQQRGLSVPNQSLHMVFTGNPGTGKTTIARLIAQIYKSLGILSKGQFVETDRSGLVAAYLGQTALKVQEIVQSALGGVLFIDEAYSLTDNGQGQDQYGAEAVNTLLKLMEDHRDDLIVIVAGYTEPMQKFVRSNPGLQSRFSKFLHFDDYAPDELTAIFRHFAASSDYQLDPATELKLMNVFTTFYQVRDETFGNARVARNLFEKAINAHASRMISAGALDEASLVTLYPEDIPNHN